MRSQERKGRGAGQEYYTAAGSIVGCALRHFLYSPILVVQCLVWGDEGKKIEIQK